MIYLITGAIFIVLLIAIFFSKEVVSSKENNIFKLMLVISLLGYLIEIPLQILVRTLDVNNVFVDVFCRFYLISISSWYSLFTIYVFVICLNKDKNYYEKFISIVIKMVIALQVILSILLFILPIVKYYDMSKMYIQGSALDLLKLYIVIYMGLYIILLLFNHRNLKNKKYLPIYFVLICLVFMTVLNSLDPSILITTMIGTFICYTMFFTIENPDLKLIRELEVARETADKANQAKSDFLSSMSHEIRTPLNAIVGFSDCIADAKNLGEAQENAKDIVNASQTLLEIVNGILDISKIEAGKLEIINTKYNAPETFEDLAKLITPRMNEKGLDFSYNIAPDLPTTLFGDHANLKKIVTNLLSNACKYTDKGFVHYEVNCVNSGNVSKLIISVEDSGRGIRKESVDKMFTKFQRLDEDRNTTIEGTGLGLAITKQLIEMMGGRIIVHTIYGQGSKFTVVLNQKITQADVDTKKVKTTLDLTGIRILMVDDTPLNLKVGCKLLEKYGANNIVTCASGFECLDRINRGEVYDAILLDDMMPKMSGVETLKKLKENPNFKIPTVALTANAITGMREKYLADGFDDYLAKPIEKNQLIQVFNQILGRSATEDINVGEVQDQINNENIRSEEVPNVVDQEKAEEERGTNNPDIIPVEENIEEILGDQLDMNYQEKTMTEMKPIQVDEIEILDENPTTPKIIPVEPIEPVQVAPVPIQMVQTIPVMDIGPIPEVNNVPNLYDKEYLESNGVDVDHALELLGDMDMYNMTISDFVKDVESKWNKIVDYKNSGNMPDYAIEVHSLKSDCKYLGFMKLADIAYQHELKSKANDSEFVNSNFDLLESEYKKVLEIAKNYTEHNVVEG
jgi:signal transduction histidine kinase/DNA-binding response OmpR family regulator